MENCYTNIKRHQYRIVALEDMMAKEENVRGVDMPNAVGVSAPE